MAESKNLPGNVGRALTRLRWRRRALALVQACAWMLLGLSMLVAAAAAVPRLGPELLPWVRTAARLWLLAWVLGPLLVFVLPPWRRTRTLLALARIVDDRVPETQDSLLTAVDLAAQLDRGEIELGPTRALARDHLRDSASRAEAVRASALVPWRSLGARTLLGPGLAGLVALLFTLHPAAISAGLGLLFTATAPSTVEASEAPEDSSVNLVLRNVVVLLEPPAYSGREPLRLDGTSGDFRALPGTRVTLEAASPDGAREVTVHWNEGEGDEKSWTQPVTGDRLLVPFVVPGRGRYRVLVSRGGLREPLRTRLFDVAALPDAPPELEVSGPPGDIQLKPEDELVLSVRSSDDFALSRLELVVEKRGRRVATRSLGDVVGQPSWEDVVRWSPREDLDGRGGELQLVVEAWDNDTVNGPKLTRSRPLEVYVPTPRDHHDRVLAMKRRLLDQSLDLLADLLVSNSLGLQRVAPASATAVFDRQDRLAAGVFETAAVLSQAMAQDRFERREVFLGIGQMIENLGRRWEAVRDVVEQSIRQDNRAEVPRSVLGQLIGRREEAISELERIVLDLGSFIDLQVNDAVRDDLAGIDPELADLADLLRQAEDGQPVDSQIEEALDELAQSLEELARKMSERSKGPDDGFMNQVPQELSQDVLSEIRQLAREGRYEEAMERIQEAMEALSEMNEALSEEAETMAGSQVSAELQQQIQEALEETRELEARQQEVIDATRELEQRFGSGETLTEEQRAELQADMDRLRELIDELPPDGLDPRTRGDVRQWARLADRVAFRMQQAFAEGGLEEAVAQGASAASYLDEAVLELEQARETAPAPRERGRRQAAEAADLAHDIVRRLSIAESQARSAQAQAAGASGPTRSQQQGIQESLGGLQQQVEQMGGSAYNPVSGRENLQNAHQMMQQAQGRLGQGRTSPAIAAEEDALRQLQAFRESLEQAQQSMQPGQRMGGSGSGMASNQPGGRQSNPWDRAEDWNGTDPRGAEVELSHPDDFVTPEAFRALVQEEAAGEAPERYVPLNNSYYEELVK